MTSDRPREGAWSAAARATPSKIGVAASEASPRGERKREGAARERRGEASARGRRADPSAQRWRAKSAEERAGGKRDENVNHLPNDRMERIEKQASFFSSPTARKRKRVHPPPPWTPPWTPRERSSPTHTGRGLLSFSNLRRPKRGGRATSGTGSDRVLDHPRSRGRRRTSDSRLPPQGERGRRSPRWRCPASPVARAVATLHAFRAGRPGRARGATRASARVRPSAGASARSVRQPVRAHGSLRVVWPVRPGRSQSWPVCAAPRLRTASPERPPPLPLTCCVPLFSVAFVSPLALREWTFREAVDSRLFVRSHAFGRRLARLGRLVSAARGVSRPPLLARLCIRPRGANSRVGGQDPADGRGGARRRRRERVA